MQTYQIKDVLAPTGKTYLSTILSESIESAMLKARQLYPEARMLQATLLENEFDKRIADKTKTPLHHNFISFIKYTDSFNNKPVDEVWRLWKEYTAKCDSYDQSPTKAEFCQWYKLECSENILKLI